MCHYLRDWLIGVPRSQGVEKDGLLLEYYIIMIDFQVYTEMDIIDPGPLISNFI